MSVAASIRPLDAALDYARRGWPVFPCNPANKRPLVARDLDATGAPIKGSGGVSKATVDPEQIGAWWRERGGSVDLNSSTRLLSGAFAGFMPLREAAG